ncbi:DUF6973 domain-containing protein [Yinghuangia sp. YIM S10712]|uniref:DUF6973 domain-containing protein n=1 Tax=Yinghuangia sp. YIM S10712 TaxID=3436930 RepID=UPI003F539A89
MAAPQDVIPGDPVGLQTVADQVLIAALGAARSAQLLTEVGSSTTGWQGQAAQGFRESLAASGARLGQLDTQVGHFVTTVYAYAEGLREAQNIVLRCLEIADAFGVPWTEVERAAFEPTVLDKLPAGAGTEAELHTRAGLVAEFQDTVVKARLRAMRANVDFVDAMRVPLSEIQHRYQVSDDCVQKAPFEANFVEDRVPQLNGYRPGNEQAMILDLSSEERAKYMLISNQAWEECRKRFPGQGELDGYADAFWHSYWNALLARNFGQEWTEKYTTAHEMVVDKSAADQKSESMDLHNNEVGRTVAAEMAGKPLDEVANAIEFAVRSGRTVVVGQDGNLYYSDQVAADGTIRADREGKTPSYDLP